MDLPTSTIEAPHFWQALQLYLQKAHVVNRRLAAVVHLGNAEVLQSQEQGTPFLDTPEMIKDNSPALLDAGELHFQQHKLQLQSPNDDDNKFLATDLHVAATQQRSRFLVLVNKLLAKNMSVFAGCYELVVIDFQLESATIICIPNPSGSLPPCSAAQPSYCVRRHSHGIRIDSSSDAKNKAWLQDTLLPKLVRWSNDARPMNGEVPQHDAGLGVDSHSLIDAEDYNVLYNQLKLKYGVQMVERWPEQTDAAKFVYEDVAIATYLLVLWRQERRRTGDDRLQSFVDLGCGNGLLVFILSSEGHPGLGIDLRKRGIWDTYPESTKLKIQAIIPSDSCLFPAFDWILGNHSDELSPWLPVIAARSSPTARYFVLPCCAFEFSGAKFQRRNAHDSQYNDFVRYVQIVSDACGFRTQIDRLKIPSTKRVCLIGASRNTKCEDFEQQCRGIQEFIDSQTKRVCSDPAVAWSDGFAARSDVEPVRNCSKIDRCIQDEIVRIVFEHLLAKRRCVHEGGAMARWNAGGQASLGELAELISSDRLRKLKSECGGLQTLLKNNHQIFQVMKGIVQVRLPVPYSERLKEIEQRPKKSATVFVFKQKRCWFLDNHPDGCPFEAAECSFSHGRA